MARLESENIVEESFGKVYIIGCIGSFSRYTSSYNLTESFDALISFSRICRIVAYHLEANGANMFKSTFGSKWCKKKWTNICCSIKVLRKINMVV